MPLAKRLHLQSMIEACEGGTKSAGGNVSTNSVDARK